MSAWKSACLALLAAHGAFAFTPQTTTVEFFNTDLQHYFITADPIEALAIDQGSAGAGWVRTGRGFGVWIDAGSAPAGAVPVCRFYSSGSHAHFYTADAAECAQLQALQGAQSAAAALAGNAFTGWAFEGDAFLALVPASGACTSGTEPIYRFYNPGTDAGTGSSHRFVSDADMAAMMSSLGWVSEGVAFCSPVAATGTSAPAAVSTGSFPELATTWTGNAGWAFRVKPGDGDTKSTAPVTLTIATDGTLTGNGNGCSIAGSINSGDGFHSLYNGSVTTTACTDAHFNGTFALHLARLGSALLGMQFGSQTASLVVEVEALLSSGTPPAPPPPPASGPTTYTGNVAWIVIPGTASSTAGAISAVTLPLTLTIDGTTLTGSGYGCAFTGTIVPGPSAIAIAASATATGCTNPAFNGTYPNIRIEREDGAALSIDFEMQTTTGSTITRVLIRGVLVEGKVPPPPPPPPPPPITGTWTGDAHWTLAKLTATSADDSGTSTLTMPLSLTLGSGGVLTGSGGGCTFGGTLTQHEQSLSGPVTASGCTNGAFNGTYSSVALDLEDGGALAVAMKMENSTVRVSIVGVLPSGSTTPPPPPPPPPFSLTGTWVSANAEWLDLRIPSATSSQSASQHALTLAIAADGSVTGSGFGCAFTGSLKAVNASATAFAGPLSATGCTNTDFNGAYGLFSAHLGDGGKLDVAMSRESASTAVGVHASVAAEMTRQ